MEILLLLGIAGGLAYYFGKSKAPAAVPPGPSAGPPNTNDGTAPGPAPTYPPPVQPPPGTNPPPSGAKPPGVYPPGTVGTFPITVQVNGGDGDSYVTATPGGVVGPMPGAASTFWYGPGTWVSFSARVAPFSLGPIPLPSFTAFDHFEGPGVSTRQNPFNAQIGGAGYVRGVFAFLGRPGG